MPKKDNELEGMNSIKLVIYFWTKEGKIQLPDRQAFPKGKVSMPTNHRKGIRHTKDKEVYFGGGNQSTIYGAIKKCLSVNDVNIIPKESISEYKKYVKVAEEIKKKEVEF